MYASTQRIDNQLGYTDQDGAHSLIANAQYLLPIAPLFYVVLYAVCIIDVQEASFGASEDLRVVRDGFAFGRRVDDGEHLREVVEDELLGGQLGRYQSQLHFHTL
jgi:hypothetical protein